MKTNPEPAFPTPKPWEKRSRGIGEKRNAHFFEIEPQSPLGGEFLPGPPVAASDHTRASSSSTWHRTATTPAASPPTKAGSWSACTCASAGRRAFEPIVHGPPSAPSPGGETCQPCSRRIELLRVCRGQHPLPAAAGPTPGDALPLGLRPRPGHGLTPPATLWGTNPV